MRPIVTFHRHDRVLVAACHGELDLAVRGDLWAALITPLTPGGRRDAPTVITDLDELDELDELDPGMPGFDLNSVATAGVEATEADPVVDLAGIETVVVDLADVPFLDCTAIGVLAALVRLTRRAGIALRVAGAQPRVRRVFTILDLDQTFALTSSLHDAIA